MTQYMLRAFLALFALAGFPDMGYPVATLRADDAEQSNDASAADNTRRDLFVLADVNAAALAAAQGSVLREYDGPLRNRPEVRAFREALPGLREQAITRQRELLGIQEANFQPRVLVVISDRPDDDPGNNMVAEGVVIDGRHIAVIQVFAGALISRRCDAEATFVHEVNHALLREYLGERYATLPKWLKEGLALWCAGQREERVRTLLAGALFKAQGVAEAARLVERLCDGFTEDFDFSDYAEAVLWVEFLIRREANALSSLTRMLKNDRSHEEAIAEIARLNWADFQAAANNYARRACHEAEGGHYVEAAELIAAARAALGGAHDDSEAAKAARRARLEKILTALGEQLRPFEGGQGGADKNAGEARPREGVHERLPYHVVPLAYYQGRIMLALTRYDEARRHFTLWLRREPGLAFSTLTGEALRYLAEAAFAAGNKPEARDACERLLHGFNHSARHTSRAREMLALLDRAESGSAPDEKGEVPDGVLNESDQHAASGRPNREGGGK